MSWARWHDSQSEYSSIAPAVITKQQRVLPSSDDVIQIKQKLEIVITEKIDNVIAHESKDETLA